MALGVKQRVEGVQYLYLNDVTGVFYVRPPGKSYITLAASTKLEAIEEMGTKMRTARTAKPTVNTTMTEHWEAVLDFQTGSHVDADERWGDRTLEQHRHHWKTNVEPQLGNVKVSEVDDLDCIAVLDALKDRTYTKKVDGVETQVHYSGSVLRQCYMTMSMLFRYAQDSRFRVRTDSPLTGVKIPKAVKIEPLSKEDILSDEDVAAVIRKAPKREGQLFRLASLTGLRSSELLGLQLVNHDPKASTLEVVNQLSRGSAKLVPLKGRKDMSGSAARVLDLSPAANQLLIELRQDLAQGPDGTTRLLGPETFFFSTRSGKPLSHRNIGRTLAIAKAEAFIERPCSMHSFRHYYASKMFAVGATIEEVQEDLGHTDPKVTRAFYVRLIDSVQRTARKAELYAKAGMA